MPHEINVGITRARQHDLPLAAQPVRVALLTPKIYLVARWKINTMTAFIDWHAASPSELQHVHLPRSEFDKG